VSDEKCRKDTPDEARLYTTAACVAGPRSHPDDFLSKKNTV